MKVKAVKLFLLGLLIFSATFTNAQAKKNLEYSGFFDSYYFRGPWSLTLGGGASLYNGDLATFFEGNKFAPTYNAGIAYKPWPRVRFGTQFAMVNFNVEEKNDRATIMKGNLKEIMFYGKYYFVEDIVTRHAQFTNDKLKLVKPFVTLGFAPVFFKATATDAQGGETSDSGISFAVPIGGGLQFDFTHRVSLSLDVAYRYVFSDQLDAFGENQGGGKAKDAYATVGLTLQYSPFAKRSHKKKFKAPKDASDQYNTPKSGSAPSGGSTNKAVPETTPPATAEPEQVTEPEEVIEETAPTEEVEEAEEEYQEEEATDDSYDDGW